MTEKIKCGQEKSVEERKEALAKILMEAEGGLMPQAIFILDGDITEVAEAENKYDFHNPNRFRPNSYYDKDLHGAITGAQARIAAGAEIGKLFPEPVLVTTDTRYHIDEPTHATISKNELVQLGIEANRILLEENSNSTITQLVEMIKIANEKGWSQIAILTSDYHIPRCQMIWEKLIDLIEGAKAGEIYKKEFIEALAEFKQNNRRIIFVAAEKVLEKVNDDYRVLIKEAKESDGYQKRVELEEKGIKDLEAGKYKVVIKF